MDRVSIAVANKQNGMNCTQAIVSAFADLVDLSQEDVMAIAQPFGMGIGATLQGTCGALIGANIILGLAGKEESRPVTMQRANEIIRSFQTKNGSITCKDLKGIETGQMLRSCPGCVEDAATFLQNVLKK